MALRIAGAVGLFLVLIGPHLISKLFGRSPWPPRFLGAAAWLAGARTRVEGRPPGPRTLLVANHLSWLDILVLGGATRCAFVSKDSLGHPFIHWLADQNRTLYVNRSDRRGAGAQAKAIADALASGECVAFFPEGTTGPGTHLLPFRPPLFEAVAPAPEGVEVRPVAIDYGSLTDEIAWYGESGRDNVLRILGRRGTIPVTVRLLEPLEPSTDRKQLAALAQAAITAALPSSSAPTRL